MVDFPLRHLTSIDDLGRNDMIALCDLADSIRAIPQRARRHQGRIIATLFYEPSTRTRLSFESAALRIGAQTIGFADPKLSSAAKGETLIDTIRTVERYADAIVLRHPAEGAALLASKVAQVPIINAGDGSHEHPTQTLFDLYTIRSQCPDLSQCVIGFIGDLKFGRTVHSLAKAASRFGSQLVFIAPDELQLPQHEQDRLNDVAAIELTDDLAAVLPRLDVLYVTRLQVERMDSAAATKHDGTLRSRGLGTQDLATAKESLMILHPLPRVDELQPELDLDHRAWYFEQVANGVLMRMALLDAMLSHRPEATIGANDAPLTPDDPPWRTDDKLADQLCGNSSCVTNVERHVALRSHDGRHCDYCGRPTGSVGVSR